MKTLMCLILLSAPAFAAQKYQYKDPQLDSEWANNYKEHRYPNWINARGSSATITYLNASTITVNGVNLPSFSSTNTWTGGNTFTSSVTLNGLNGTFIGLGRNRIINGDMSVDQRNEGALVTPGAGGSYGVDRWIGYDQGAPAVFKTQRLTTSPPTGFNYYTHFTVTTASAAPFATSSYIWGQYVEGYNIVDFSQGLSDAKAFTLSFYAKSTMTGNFCVAFQNTGGGRSYPATYTINAANTWERKAITIPGDTTGSANITNGVGFFIIFDLGSGSNANGTANTWQAGAKTTVSGYNQLIANTANTLDITAVQLEIGSMATAFEFLPWPDLLVKCQRYYEKSYAIGTAAGSAAGAGSTWLTTCSQIAAATMECPGYFKVVKRTNPTMAYWAFGGTSGKMTFKSTAGAVNDRTITTIVNSPYNFQYEQTTAVEAFTSGNWTADADF